MLVMTGHFVIFLQTNTIVSQQSLLISPLVSMHLKSISHNKQTNNAGEGHRKSCIYGPMPFGKVFQWSQKLHPMVQCRWLWCTMLKYSKAPSQLRATIFTWRSAPTSLDVLVQRGGKLFQEMRIIEECCKCCKLSINSGLAEGLNVRHWWWFIFGTRWSTQITWSHACQEHVINIYVSVVCESWLGIYRSALTNMLCNSPPSLGPGQGCLAAN